jgi:large subunit ribosomal protein L37Ae
MATKKKQLGSIKRFGTRYGRTNKHKLAAIENEQKRAHACPVCHYDKVTRLSNGIWTCTKCKAKFTSRAYAITKLPKLQTGEEKKGA